MRSGSNLSNNSGALQMSVCTHMHGSAPGDNKQSSRCSARMRSNLSNKNGALQMSLCANMHGSEPGDNKQSSRCGAMAAAAAAARMRSSLKFATRMARCR